MLFKMTMLSELSVGKHYLISHNFVNYLKLKKNFNNINEMHNRNTTYFQTLKELPTPFEQSQCVLHKYELLICGGAYKRACYSYHILKNKYKFICQYPSDIDLVGHCVVKLINNDKDNQITLLSFGGYCKHTLVMKYVSVWNDDNNNYNENKTNKSNNYNKWIPFTDNHNHPIIIGIERDNDDYEGVRALIGGINNHLLFITYFINNISVFDLNTFQYIKHTTLPTDNEIYYHCFVSKEMMKTNKKNKQNYQMLLFCKETGLSIEYDEDNNTFQFYQLYVCHDIAPLFRYAYVYINNIILFFGGYGNGVSKSVHMYLIQENKWMIFKNTLPSPLRNCVAIFNEEDNNIHIIGGINDKDIKVSTHMKTKVCLWDPSQLVMICLFIIYLF
ncbi:hypothetical protein RFI_00802 [Reticulomyxa filosa]|uniref:Uncharacterized protein n=1 Tax=Reticulomyxa filosa TaxID=46433 RepID=X6PCK0_RETFI|nr:hypothetical protein RFI_00802 [Reticulomyxa filosa]|eukprot:ETO36260.1 hypothetical protein RFI_00802 [Reticulomyxa filosa]